MEVRVCIASQLFPSGSVPGLRILTLRAFSSFIQLTLLVLCYVKAVALLLIMFSLTDGCLFLSCHEILIAFLFQTNFGKHIKFTVNHYQVNKVPVLYISYYTFTDFVFNTFIEYL